MVRVRGQRVLLGSTRRRLSPSTATTLSTLIRAQKKTSLSDPAADKPNTKHTYAYIQPPKVCKIASEHRRWDEHQRNHRDTWSRGYSFPGNNNLVGRAGVVVGVPRLAGGQACSTAALVPSHGQSSQVRDSSKKACHHQSWGRASSPYTTSTISCMCLLTNSNGKSSRNIM